MSLKHKKQELPQRLQIESELDRLEQGIADLKIQYEQFFLGVRQQSPEKLEQDMLRIIRDLKKAPLPQASSKFKLQTLTQRLQTFQSRWQRIKREREEGTFAPDVFKAKIRQKEASEKKAARAQGRLGQEVRRLYELYGELMREAGKADSLPSLDAFKKVVLREAKRVQEQTGEKRISFNIRLEEGRPKITATVKKNPSRQS